VRGHLYYWCCCPLRSQGPAPSQVDGVSSHDTLTVTGDQLGSSLPSFGLPVAPHWLCARTFVAQPLHVLPCAGCLAWLHCVRVQRSPSGGSALGLHLPFYGGASRVRSTSGGHAQCMCPAPCSHSRSILISHPHLKCVIDSSLSIPNGYHLLFPMGLRRTFFWGHGHVVH